MSKQFYFKQFNSAQYSFNVKVLFQTIQFSISMQFSFIWPIDRRTLLTATSRDELISDVLLLTPTYGQAKAGRPARTYVQQLCEDTGCCPEDLPEAMNDSEKWRERVRDIHACGMTWWWFQARVDLGAMAIKGYSTSLKAAASLKPHYQIV